MGSDFIPDPQGVHQHSLEWPGGAYAPMHPPVSAPDNCTFLQGCIFSIIKLNKINKLKNNPTFTYQE